MKANGLLLQAKNFTLWKSLCRFTQYIWRLATCPCDYSGFKSSKDFAKRDSRLKSGTYLVKFGPQPESLAPSNALGRSRTTDQARELDGTSPSLLGSWRFANEDELKKQFACLCRVRVDDVVVSEMFYDSGAISVQVRIGRRVFEVELLDEEIK